MREGEAEGDLRSLKAFIEGVFEEDEALESSGDAKYLPTVEKVVSGHDFECDVDGRPAIYLNGRCSRITHDDNCWVVQNKMSEMAWEFTPWIFAEAKEILDSLPRSPAEARRLGMFD